MKIIYLIFLTIVSFAATLYAQSPFQHEFQQLKAQRDKAIAAAIQPINQNYQKALQDLLLRATQNKDLEAITPILAELKEIEARPVSGPNDPQSLLGKWRGDGNALLFIRPDNTAEHSGDLATWEIRNGNLFLKWNNGCGHRIPLNQVGERIRAYQINPGGQVHEIQLTRVP